MSEPYINYIQATKGIKSWLFTTYHKRIGIMYLTGLTFFFLVAMSIGFVMKLEMLTPGKTVVEAQTYNALFTLHGIIMIFLFIIPGNSCNIRKFFSAY